MPEKCPTSKLTTGGHCLSHLMQKGDSSYSPQLLYPFSGGTRPLTGGIQFRRLPDEENRPKFGTLGYIATRLDDNVPVLLSCEHVLISRKNDEKLVFQPDYSKCSGIYYNDVGTVTDGTVNNVSVEGEMDVFFIDAAVAEVYEDIGTRRSIPNVGDITGSENIINAPTDPPINVKKMGSASDYTEGVIESVSANLGPARNFIKINPVAGKTFTYKVRRRVHPDVVDEVLADFPDQAFQGIATLVDSTNKIVEFESEVFTLPGDSGAQLVNEAGKIVGMIFSGEMYEVRAFDEEAGRWRIAGVPQGPGFACHIQPVLERFQLRIDPSSDTSAGKAVTVPGNSITGNNPDRFTRLSEKLSDLEQELRTTKEGLKLVQLVQSFFEEVVHLVHHDRSVKVTWYRNNGPAFMATFFRCISEPCRPIPNEVDGIPTKTLLARMKEALSKAGSSGLYRALKQYENAVYHLLDSSQNINELLQNIKLGLSKEADNNARYSNRQQ